MHVSNVGPQTAEAVKVVETLPVGFTFVSATGSGWICDLTGSTLTCTRASLAVGAAPDISLVIRAPLTAGTMTNQASISSTLADPGSSNNQSSRDVMVVAVAVPNSHRIYLPFTIK